MLNEASPLGWYTLNVVWVENVKICSKIVKILFKKMKNLLHVKADTNVKAIHNLKNDEIKYY